MKIRHLVALFMLIASLGVAAIANAAIVVRMETVEGNILVSLRDDVVKDTVDNFLRYVDAGLYNNSFIHRSVPGFVIQGGSFVWNGAAPPVGPYFPIQTFPPINGQRLLSNVRGTIAMALTSDVNQVPQINSATSGWFINLADNSSTLDASFTVFGTVIDDGMTVADAIAALPVENQGGPFAHVPLINHVLGQPVVTGNIVLLSIYRAVQGTSGDYTTLHGPDPSTVTVDTYTAAANPSSSDAPVDVTFGEGFFSIGLSNVAVGGQVSVALNLPATETPNTYYRYGPTPDNHTPHWYNFMWDGTTGAIVGIDPHNIALVFVDGKRGDDDYTANGVIATGVGAPGVGPAATSSGGGGGGAFDIYSLLAGMFIVTRKLRARASAAIR